MLVLPPEPKILVPDRKVWTPDLQPKQLDLYNDDRRNLFAIGARGSGKTWGIEHLVCKHCWRVKFGKVAIILLTKKTADEGIWEELTGRIYEEWINGGVGNDKSMFEYAREPHVDPHTKVNEFSLWNRYGEQSRVVVFPLKRAEDAMARLLSTQWTMIWISEAHLYKSAKVWRQSLSQLRHPEVPFSEMKLVCDMNPPEEGLSHWFYDLRDRELKLDPAEFPEEWPESTRRAMIEQQRQTAIYRFLPSDNKRLDPERQAAYEATYARDPREYRRLVLGLDEEGGEPSDLFGSIFQKSMHVYGSADGPDESKWEVLLPVDSIAVEHIEDKVLLLDGWDPGDVNHAWVAAQPWTNADGKECYDILDEFQVLHGTTTTDTLTEKVMERRWMIHEQAEIDGFQVSWKSMSDSSVMRFRSASKGGRAAPEEDEHTDAAEIMRASMDWLKKNGPHKGQVVRLVGTANLKKKGWQKRRVNLLQKLLRENRIRISAHCKNVIRMFEHLRKNSQENARTYISPTQDEKHMFDALSYLIGMRLMAELNHIEPPKVARRAIAV